MAPAKSRGSLEPCLGLQPWAQCSVQGRAEGLCMAPGRPHCCWTFQDALLRPQAKVQRAAGREDSRGQHVHCPAFAPNRPQTGWSRQVFGENLLPALTWQGGEKTGRKVPLRAQGSAVGDPNLLYGRGLSCELSGHPVSCSCLPSLLCPVNKVGIVPGNSHCSPQGSTCSRPQFSKASCDL